MSPFRKFLLFSILLSISMNASGQQKIDFCARLQRVEQKIIEHHYRPRPFDDDFASWVHKNFLKRIDPEFLVLTAEDSKKFEPDGRLLDDYLESGDCSFLEKYTAALQIRLTESQAILNDLRKVDLSYDGRDTLWISSEPKTGFRTQDKKVDFYRRYIKYATLSELYAEYDGQTTVQKYLGSEERSFRNKIIDRELCMIEERLGLKGGLKNQVESAFLKSVLAYQDPHSTYFDDADKNDFEQLLAKSKITTGIQTEKNADGEIGISHITPGSAAFKNGGLEEDDVVERITTAEKTLGTDCISNTDVQEFLNDDRHEKVKVTVKKKDGSRKEVTLIKSEINIEENNLTAYLLKKPKPVGYIRIPSFYTDMESPNGLGIANDFAKELIKLQQEQIEALIIDVRDNGGGSMFEASNLSGLFVNIGPLAIVQDAKGEVETLRDMNRGSMFNKPVLVLVNSRSASASEFFASALQDYNQAIVVGSKSYGKASAQLVMPLFDDEQGGHVKLTTGAFYRVSGRSIQSQGVLPDIVLPTVFDGFPYYESANSQALVSEKVPVTLKPRTLARLPVELLREKGKARLIKDTVFNMIKMLNQELREKILKSEETIPLSWEGIQAYQDRQLKFWANAELRSTSNTVDLPVENTTSHREILTFDATGQEQDDLIKAKIGQDPYINEAYTILIDYLTLKKEE